VVQADDGKYCIMWIYIVGHFAANQLATPECNVKRKGGGPSKNKMQLGHACTIVDSRTKDTR
jgi:hypothetical protein